jgi:hypothetical protein
MKHELFAAALDLCNPWYIEQVGFEGIAEQGASYSILVIVG